MPASTPRPEYPRPQFERQDWLCLNGPWQFEIDSGDSGLERGLVERPLQGTIQVPFCPESTLSGIANTDFLNVVWYRREMTIPAEWAGREVLLHFQAVDYDTTIWINGQEAARHRGGFTPITIELKGIAQPGQTVVIVVRARDFHRQPKPRGKQSSLYANHGCDYTRTTGIWQTVWMEPVGAAYFRRPRITPDVSRGLFRLELPVLGGRPGQQVKAILKDSQGILNTASVQLGMDFSPFLELEVPAERRQLWQPGSPYLYQFEFQLLDRDGQVLDSASSYAGLRSVAMDGLKVLINGQPVFQRLVLDQGYYAEGILTAPSDADLIQDIELSMKAGFNGARLHQKVFEERFLYHADRLGYLVWGEFPDWGVSSQGWVYDHQKPTASYITQWLEEIERDYSHPAIIGWCPLNETWQPLSDQITTLDEVTLGMFLAARMDPTRPVLDTSGYSHRVPWAMCMTATITNSHPRSLPPTMPGRVKGNPTSTVAGPIRATSFPSPTAGNPSLSASLVGSGGTPRLPRANIPGAMATACAVSTSGTPALRGCVMSCWTTPPCLAIATRN